MNKKPSVKGIKMKESESTTKAMDDFITSVFGKVKLCDDIPKGHVMFVRYKDIKIRKGCGLSFNYDEIKEIK